MELLLASPLALIAAIIAAMGQASGYALTKCATTTLLLPPSAAVVALLLTFALAWGGAVAAAELRLWSAATAPAAPIGATLAVGALTALTLSLLVLRPAWQVLLFEPRRARALGVAAGHATLASIGGVFLAVVFTILATAGLATAGFATPGLATAGGAAMPAWAPLLLALALGPRAAVLASGAVAGLDLAAGQAWPNLPPGAPALLLVLAGIAAALVTRTDDAPDRPTGP